MKGLTLQRLCELLAYEPETGNFYWKIKKGPKRPGDIAGTKNTAGYIQISVDNVLHYAHRLAYFYMTGEEPENIDHINRVRSDNRWENLRNGTPMENAQNREGKGWCKTPWGYSASITVNYGTYHLGYFQSEEKAREAYLWAKEHYHPTYQRGHHG